MESKEVGVYIDDGKKIGEGTVGPVTKVIMESFREITEKEAE